jgi:hypothetical protein
VPEHAAIKDELIRAILSWRIRSGLTAARRH